MAGPDRTATDSVELLRTLARAPHEFDFFQALRRLESAHPDKPRLGEGKRPIDEPLRLGQEPTLAFAPSTLASLRLRGNRPPRLEVFCFGLFGPNGPLPLHLTEYARDRLRNHDDPTFARFADMFHHRLLALFYRAWSSLQPAVSYDRPEHDRFGQYLGSVFGLGMPALRDRDAVPDLAKLYYAGLLAEPTHHADGLRAMLADYFSVPVAIEQFVGHWLALSEDNMTRLGDPVTGALGVSAVAGARVWDVQHMFRIRVGPLGYADYQRLLPGGDSLERLVALVRNYIDDGLHWDLQLVLKKEEVPPLQLGESGRLGWTTWSATGPLERDPDDLALDAAAFVAR